MTIMRTPDLNAVHHPVVARELSKQAQDLQLRIADLITRFAGSMQFVFGSEVDYVEGLQGAGFVVNNPNVVAACGCGSSFQVKEDAAAAATA